MSGKNSIRNPLTIIAIFAGIAEISGTGVLPFISQDNQRLYIWFLIFFPSMLVFLFFATLNFNRSVLYAPSDWQDETNFFRRFSKATDEELASKAEEEKIETEKNGESDLVAADGIEGTVEEPAQSDAKVTITAPVGSQSRRYGATTGLSYLSSIERNALTRLGSELEISFDRNVKFSSKLSPSIVFDGVAYDGNLVHVVEVKYVRIYRNIVSFLNKILPRYQIVSDEFRNSGRRMFLHFVIVTGNEISIEEVNNIKMKSRKIADEYRIKVQFHLYKISDLDL
ncbi:hypothetical protein V6767_16260 [Martelella sp. FLE1502]